MMRWKVGCIRYSRNRRKGESVAEYHARRIREADARIPEPILAMMYGAEPPEHVRALLAANTAFNQPPRLSPTSDRGPVCEPGARGRRNSPQGTSSRLRAACLG